ncbi:PEP-CTERM sorting domain-containing protein [Pseudoduganella albidiflava]|uniref:Ice-binding protein C-terminal domain-containing protein n=2 Tax=Pseudoduganella albidiflava TaxID=321983 RepID=A0AA87XX43_9BURK|nr:PEP-CTERM sorting domain-containing protein [Pseudoduganella albidiflava]GGY42521.1 hypothetical protein GCM10007387_25630 [Pseudoduganella albidiflava]
MRPLFRTLCTTFLLGAVGAFAPVHAAVPVIDTAGFSLSGVDELPYLGIDLVSDLPGYATFSLWGVGQAAHASADSRGFPEITTINHWQSGYGITVKDGYRITGITLTGEFYAAQRPAQYSTPGAANSDTGMVVTVERPGELPATEAQYTEGLDGRKAFRYDLAPAGLTGDMTLSLQGYTIAWAQSAWYQEDPAAGFWLGSYADAGIANLRMMVAVSPVPEPQACLMLLGGLGVVAAVARRRRRLV